MPRAAGAALERAQPQRERDELLLRAVVEVALEPPPLGLAGGDDPLPRGVHLVELGADLAGQALVVEREPAAAATARQQLGLLAQRGVVHERAEHDAVALEQGGGEPVAGRGQRDLAAVGVEVALAARATSAAAAGWGRRAPAASRPSRRPGRGRRG